MIEFPRITRDPKVMMGKPCIRGMRVTVGMVAGQIGSGTTIEEMLQHYPYVEREDIPRSHSLRWGYRVGSRDRLAGAN